MGVDVRLYLYRSADLKDVANALSILAGNDPNPQPIRGGGKSWEYPQPKVEIKNSGDLSPTMWTIQFNSEQTDPHNQVHFTYVHLTSDHGFGFVASPPSTPWWIAVCRRLVDLFGGALDYNDCDLSEADYFRFETPIDHDALYVARQRAILDLKPVTGPEIEACRGFAAYSDMGSYLMLGDFYAAAT